MLSLVKKSILALLLLNIIGCSYSPASLKSIYNDLPEMVSSEFLDAASFTPEQSVQINAYAKALIKWHRQRKLPEYAQTFSNMSNAVLQEKIPVSPVQGFLNKMDGMPHFYQATHLTHKLATVARSLSDSQISQLEKSLENNRLEEFYEVKNTPLAKDLRETINHVLGFLDVKLNSQQIAIISRESKKLHDLRFMELDYGKKWNKELIDLLKKSRNTPQYFVRFAQLWDKQDSVLTGKSLSLEKQNNRIFSELIQKLVNSMSLSQRQQLSRQLLSMSQAFSELANE